MTDTPTVEQQIAQEFRYEPESQRECRACGHAAPHNGSWPAIECIECQHCREHNRLIADLRHALAMERAKHGDGCKCCAWGIAFNSYSAGFGDGMKRAAHPPTDGELLDIIEAHATSIFPHEVCDSGELFASSAHPVDPAPKEPERACKHKHRDLTHPRPGRCCESVYCSPAGTGLPLPFDYCGNRLPCSDHPPVDPTGLDTLNAITGERSHRLGVEELERLAAANTVLTDPASSPSSPSDDRKERLAAACEIVFAMHIYPNYRLDSRGPRGCLYDAVKLLAPDIAASVEQCGWDDTFNKYFDEDGDPRDPSPSDREPVTHRHLYLAVDAIVERIATGEWTPPLNDLIGATLIRPLMRVVADRKRDAAKSEGA